MSASGRSIFYKVATKEDDYTQLLCNLMQRPEGRDFRTAVLSLLLGDPLLALSIEPEQISTQIIFPGAGRPDLVITSSTMIAAVEVKITRHRSCTDNQDLSDDSLEGYWGFLKEAREARKILSLVVPRDWKYLEENRERRNERRRRDTAVDLPPIVTWEQIFGMSKQFSHDPLHREFWRLLERDFGPIEFSQKEIEMIVSDAGLPIRAINKVSYLVDAIAKKCNGSFSFDGPMHDRSGEQYGLEFYRKLGKGRGDSFFFWFGVWSPFWEKYGKPLCFGISNNKHVEIEAFLGAYTGETNPDFCTDEFGALSDHWTLGWIPEEDLDEDLAGEDPVNRVWNRLRPILERVYAAGSDTPSAR
jgi:hypothetical protein